MTLQCTQKDTLSASQPRLGHLHFLRDNGWLMDWPWWLCQSTALLVTVWESVLDPLLLLSGILFVLYSFFFVFIFFLLFYCTQIVFVLGSDFLCYGFKWHCIKFAPFLLSSAHSTTTFRLYIFYRILLVSVIVLDFYSSPVSQTQHMCGIMVVLWCGMWYIVYMGGCVCVLGPSLLFETFYR